MIADNNKYFQEYLDLKKESIKLENNRNNNDISTKSVHQRLEGSKFQVGGLVHEKEDFQSRNNNSSNNKYEKIRRYKGTDNSNNNRHHNWSKDWKKKHY